MTQLLILALSAFVSSHAEASLRDTEVECTLTTAQSKNVAKVSLFADANEIHLQLRNGTVEVLKPVEMRSQGLFGMEDFSPNVSWSNGQVAATSPTVGDVFIRHACYLTPTLFFERCLVQATGEPAPYSAVRMNLEGKVLSFRGNSICVRRDLGPF